MILCLIGCADLISILMARWPLMEATSGVVRPISKKRLIGQPARLRMRLQAGLVS
jgi:hypothetical protein